MVSAWFWNRIYEIYEQNKYMKAILWAYANKKISGSGEAQKAIEIVENWGEDDKT